MTKAAISPSKVCLVGAGVPWNARAKLDIYSVPHHAFLRKNQSSHHSSIAVRHISCKCGPPPVTCGASSVMSFWMQPTTNGNDYLIVIPIGCNCGANTGVSNKPLFPLKAFSYPVFMEPHRRCNTLCVHGCNGRHPSSCIWPAQR